MRLKSLELQGFKSFPDKTRISFDRGVTAIVGPNGSGKSNISDAVRWVLGELSSKSIRGTKMEDVIFGGTDKRRQMSFAEVSLTIDNSDVGDRMAIDFDEVTVTRRYYRSGDSEYMINRKTAKLRDITELFMNTGIGHSGYSIIGQGRVAEIISQRSEDRRGIFEEAAGIAKYRYKKNEAEKKLAETEDNLLRASDILSEISGRLGPLEKDAARAKKYLELFEKKKREDVSVALFDIKTLRAEADVAERACVISKHELELADGELNSLDTQSEALTVELGGVRLGQEKNERLLRENDDRSRTLENEISVLENDISHLTRQLSETEADVALKKNARAEADTRLDGADKASTEAAGRLSEAENEWKSESRRLEELRVEAAAAESAFAALGGEHERLREELTDVRLRLSELVGARHSDVERKDRSAAAVGELRRNLEVVEKRIKQAGEALSSYAAKNGELESSAGELNAKLAVCEEEKGKLNDAISRFKLDISSKAQRIDTIRRMEELFEGYNQSVRYVMNAAERGELAGICGPVSRIIEVPARYSVAVETALGANIQNIVTEDEDAAKSAIALLKRGNAGRATFYPLTSVRSQPLNVSENDLKRYKGYVGVASELVKYDAKFAGVLGYMLGRTVVFDDLDDASVMARAFGYRVRVVTLDGQLINAGGSFTGGSVKRDSGMLTRGSEIDRLRGDITRLNTEVKAYAEKLGETSERAGELINEKNEIKKRQNLVNSLYQAENTQLQILKNQYSADGARLKTLEAELDALNISLEGHEEAKAKLEADSDRLSAVTAELAAKKTESAGKSDALKSEISLASERTNALLVGLTAARKDAESAKRDLEFAKVALASLDEQVARGGESAESAKEKIRAANEAIADKRAETGRLTAESARLGDERARLAERSAGLERKSAGLRDKTKELSRRREELFRENTRLESKREQLRSDIDKLTSKLWDEYELSPGAAGELGYPELDEGSRAAAVSRQYALRAVIRELGTVNVGAIDEYKEVRERYEFLDGQINDLKKSREDFASVINKLEFEMRTRFSSVFEDINRNFAEVFAELFGGGRAELSLSDPDNVLTSGIEISIAPPGKIIKSLTLLSGGEQAFVAIALLFAVLKVTPTPFCIFDEIEAALDEVNVTRFADYCRRRSDKTQFILITHRRGTMESADMLYGVTMYERGISNVLTLNVAEAEEKLGITIGER